MNTLALLQAAELEFGAARLATYLTGIETRDIRTVLEVQNPSVDTKWRQAALIAKAGNGDITLLPPANPSDPSDWKRAERLA